MVILNILFVFPNSYKNYCKFSLLTSRIVECNYYSFLFPLEKCLKLKIVAIFLLDTITEYKKNPIVKLNREETSK